MTDLRQLIIDDMKPALGVTEPAAIALACAQAHALSDEPVEKVVVRVNSGIYNQSQNQVGVGASVRRAQLHSAVPGKVAGNTHKLLAVLMGPGDKQRRFKLAESLV